jgi:hypothetical protein
MILFMTTWFISGVLAYMFMEAHDSKIGNPEDSASLGWILLGPILLGLCFIFWYIDKTGTKIPK